jgi:DNA replication and repair protein RecF
MVFVSSLMLNTVRCYDQAKISGLRSGLIAIHGANGAGKTNILEAVSLLSPGRGIRGAKPSDFQNAAINPAVQPWAIAAKIQTSYGEIKIGTGFDAATDSSKRDKRIVRIQGETVSSQNALADHVSCVWLTPQMDRLFLDSAGHRRRFLDRLIFAFDPGHSGRCSRYDNAMAQRSKLLKTGQDDPAWIGGLESQMVETGVAIAAARVDFIGRLQAACDAAEHTEFPRAILAVTGTIEELIGKTSAVDVEDLFAHQLVESRAQDKVTGGAAPGPHKSDLVAKMADKNMAADQCSTGEQKALLIGIVLSHARLIAAERGAPPILLLDEIAAHLDDGRRAALYEILQDLKAQVWMTGTDRSLFDAVQDSAQFFEIDDGQIRSV